VERAARAGRRRRSAAAGRRDREVGEPAELAAKHRFISFEEIASAELVKKLPPRVHLTLHSGEKLPLYRGLTSETLDKDSDEAFFQGLAPFFQA
jgi:hypothetical protein